MRAPLRLMHYSVYNLGNKTVAFVPHDFSPQNAVKIISKRKTKPDVSDQNKKKFLGTVTFDSLTNNHGRIKRIFKLLNKERYYLPMSVPDVKLKQYIFSLRKMKRKIGIQ